MKCLYQLRSVVVIDVYLQGQHSFERLDCTQWQYWEGREKLTHKNQPNLKRIKDLFYFHLNTRQTYQQKIWIISNINSQISLL